MGNWIWVLVKDIIALSLQCRGNEVYPKTSSENVNVSNSWDCPFNYNDVKTYWKIFGDINSVFKLCYDMTVKGRVSYAAKEENISSYVNGLFGNLFSCHYL